MEPMQKARSLILEIDMDLAVQVASSAPIASASRAVMVEDADHRTRHFRRFKQLVAEIAEQIGGAEGLTAAQASTLRNIAALKMRAEQIQGSLVRGETVDGAELARVLTVSEQLLSVLRRGRAALNSGSPTAVPAELDALTIRSNAAAFRNISELEPAHAQD